jgi:hypothetical protein
VGTTFTTWITEFAEVPPPGAGFATDTFTAPVTALVSVAASETFTCVALTNVVVFAVLLKVTTVEELKFVPFTVSVNTAPCVTAVGEREVIVGTGLFTVNGELLDMPPPGAGLVTVTLRFPAEAISAAVIAAVNCVALTNVVVAAVPLKFTTEDATKFVPLTVRVKAAPPAVPLVGEIVVIVGDGLFTVKV